MSTRKRKLAQTPSARTLRQATAYFRLYWKAQKNGENGTGYFDQAIRLQERGYRMRKREQEREAAKAAWAKGVAHSPIDVL